MSTSTQVRTSSAIKIMSPTLLAIDESAAAAETVGPIGLPAKQVPEHPNSVAARAPKLERPRRITFKDIADKRTRAGKLVALTASASDSDMFKVAAAGQKPKARRWDHLLSQESASRKPCRLKQAALNLRKPGIISLGGGLPCPDNFPIESISMRVPSVSGGFSEADTRAHGLDVTVGKYDVQEQAEDPNGAVYDLSIALNYSQATGSAQMMRFVTEHTELVNNPPYADWRCSMSIGSTGALEMALRIFCDRARNDSMLTEEFSFSTAVETAMPLGIKVFGVPVDGEGLIPEKMDEILRTWKPEERKGAAKPHVLYTVPSGQNPTGSTQSEERRRALYQVCREHDVYIIEDEPYYYIQMPPYRGRDAKKEEEQSNDAEETPEQFLESLVPSILSMDVDGRVLRMDSFSKVVVPGSRMGWVTASEQIIDRFIRHGESCNQGPSGIAQVLLHKLLDETWGHEGYIRWLMSVRGEYTRRRDVLLAACEDHLPREVVNWEVPKTGMFHWLKVDHTKHPCASTMSISEMEAEIFKDCIDNGVLVAAGSWFMADHDAEPSGLFFRATFAAATPDNMIEATRRLGDAIRSSFQLN
uniref:aromatic-amino-acid transaminase n=1 Tax=Pyricularia oryzae (strain P131) TaxID=1143193 RepID=L7IYN6_PYRO1